MPSRYWVTGGNGLWSSSTNWSATSGGASGASSPVSTDDVYFDANSGSGNSQVTTSTINNLNCTGFTGSWSGTGQLNIGGSTIVMSASMTSTWTGSLTLTNASVSITSNGFLWNVLTITTAAQTITLVDTMGVTQYTHTAGGTTNTINGGNLVWRGTGTFTISSGRFLTGTSTVVLAPLVSGSISITGGIYNNVSINATGTISQIGAITIYSGTWTYTAGTWNTGTSAFSILGSCTLNLSGMNVYRLLPGAVSVCSLTSLLTVTTDVNVSIAVGAEFGGTHGFTCVTLGTNASSSGRSIVLKSGVQYYVTGALDIIGGFRTSKSIIKASTPGTKAKLTLSPGVAIESAACDFTDIDASNGVTIWTYYGTVSNCDNVKNLPHSPLTITYSS